MATRQSKIDITDSLRKHGVWESASWFKDQYKRRLIAQGLTRREANEGAWEEMENQFSNLNLERYLVLEMTLMAEYPPHLDEAVADELGEPPLQFIWKVWCLSLARLNCWENDDFDFASAMAGLIAQVETEQSYKKMLKTALFEVNLFVQKIAAPKFMAVIDRLEDQFDSDQRYAQELLSHVREMTRFGVCLEEYM